MGMLVHNCDEKWVNTVILSDRLRCALGGGKNREHWGIDWQPQRYVCTVHVVTNDNTWELRIKNQELRPELVIMQDNMSAPTNYRYCLDLPQDQLSYIYYSIIALLALGLAVLANCPFCYPLLFVAYCIPYNLNLTYITTMSFNFICLIDEYSVSYTKWT